MGIAVCKHAYIHRIMILACFLWWHVKTWITFLVKPMNITNWTTKSWSHTLRCFFLRLHDNHLFLYQDENMSEARTSSTTDEEAIKVTHFLSWFFLVISLVWTIIVMSSKERHLLIYLYILRDNLISGITFNTFYTRERKKYHQS